MEYNTMSKYIVCEYITQTITKRYLVDGEFANDQTAAEHTDDDNLYETEVTGIIIDEKRYVEKTFDDAFISEDEYDNRQLNIPEQYEERSEE